jgi:hypothetical protein
MDCFFRTDTIRPRLPKKAEKFIFFRITNVKEFKKGLPMMADFITTGEAALKNRADIFKRKAQGIEGLIQGLVSFNIAFSANGLAKVSTGNSYKRFPCLFSTAWGGKAQRRFFQRWPV